MPEVRDRRIAPLIGVFLSRSAASTLVPPCLPALAELYGVSYAGAGTLMATFFAAYTVAVVAASTWGRRVSRRRLLLAGAAFQVVATVGVGLAGSLPAARLAAVAFGFGGLADLLATAILADLGGARSGRLLSWAHGGFALGAVAVPALAGVALDAGVSPRTLFLCAAALNLGMLAWLWGTVRDVEPHAGGAPRGTVRRLGRDRAFRAGMAVLFLYILAEVVLSVWLPTWLGDRFGAGVTLASASLAVFWGTMLLGRVVSAPFVDRVPPLRLLAGAGGATVLVLAAMLAAPTAGLALAGVVAVGLAMASMVPVLQSRVVRRFPGASVQVLGLFGLASGVAGVASPWIVGRVAERVQAAGAAGPGGGLTLAMALAPVAMAALLPLLPALGTRPGDGG